MTEEQLLEAFRGRAAFEIEDVRRVLVDVLAGTTPVESGDVIRLCCLLLCNNGDPKDSLLIWQVHQADQDLSGAVHVEMLCGAGIDDTKAYLRSCEENIALKALEYIGHFEAEGTFENFKPELYVEDWKSYFE